MTTDDRRVERLVEYESRLLTGEELSFEEGEKLWREFGTRVTVEFPSPVTSGKWRLTAHGWVGYLPVSSGLGIELVPKVGIRNLFGMLEYAYRLKSFKVLDDLYTASSIEDFYERLAGMLARRVLDRSRKGLYRSYLSRTERLPYVRGRMDVLDLSRRPWQVEPMCEYEEHTADIEDNRILAWTLFAIARTGLLSEERELPTVRRAYRALQGFAETHPLGPESCLGRNYDRLNADYEPMHALCRFFLDNSGPTYEAGDRAMLPFLVDMARLYELFVAEWLKANLPEGVVVRSQVPVDLDAASSLRFDVDLVLYEADADHARCVLDTKYKAAPSPLPDDVAQVVAYAEALGCQEAFLVYPGSLARPLDARVGGIRVRSLSFSIGGDLEAAGRQFARAVLEGASTSAPALTLRA